MGMTTVSKLLTTAVVIAGCLLFYSAAAQGGDSEIEIARKAIVEGNRLWGKARVAYDRAAMEKMVTPDFYVKIGEQTISGKEFLDQVSDQSGPKLTRFDVEVLTVQRRGDLWVAVIAEKLEIESTAPDGKKVKGYSLWITKDGWKQTGARWQVAFSEAVGWENWRGGKKPPFGDW